MTPSRPPSTLANSTTILLPPMDASPASAKPPLPSSAQSSDEPPITVYALKLTDDVAKTLCGASDDAFLEFTSPDTGQISIPGAKPFKFNARPIGDGADSARAACFSRRGLTLRSVGRITAEIELEQRMNSQIASNTKKRTLEASNAGKSREVKVVDHIAVPTKKPRVRKNPVEKRPRAPRSRPTSTGLSSSLGPPKSSANGHAHLLRSTPNRPPTPSPFTSPVESPAPLGQSSYVSGQNGSRRSTPTPGSHPPSVPSVRGRVSPSNPLLRSTKSSRGPSPRPASVNSPSSPRTGNLRPKSEDPIELRRNIIHILALGQTTVQALKSRLFGSDGGMEGDNTLYSILREVGVGRQGSYVLKDRMWPEVSETYEAYSEMERTRMRVTRSEALNSNPKARSIGEMNGSVGQNTSMTDAELDAALDGFDRMKPGTLGTKITSADQEREMRQMYTKLYPLYTEMYDRLEEMGKLFNNLDKMFREATTAAEKDNLLKRLNANCEKFSSQHQRLSTSLPRLHTKLKTIKGSLAKFHREYQGKLVA